ncbi:IS200/IS605 family element RNA-guided endonuclease TnpB [Exiguobacterium alkaliphilum]|uniref:IS200/IS605 family element RNA-guided endonuclease TnpB n=1 Tax=Exiguobacterium alkaliphilum TaxID=1428684 RepID=UPI001BA5789E|nr:IS200/IS605 family element RNA-guided endonuclease TnpB [Exiguobacterium alkaliphilum]QUE87339.1 IS200/IS605 family element transposase accessory protein TnpB [Exiguobacterium alkaliphilum]
MLKAYKFRLSPTKPQQEYFMKTFGCVRFVYNKMLEERIRLYEESKLNPDAKQKLPTPAKYKPEFPFLKEVDSLSLANAQMDLNKAYANFFRDKSVGFPKFKSKHGDRASYTTNNQNGSVRIEDGKVKLPKIGFVKFKQHRSFEGIIKSATISMTKTGKFFVSILVDQKEEEWIPAKNKVGIDLGLEHFVIMTNDEMVSKKIDNPRFLRKSEEKVKKAQRALSRKKVGSKNREKAKLILAKKHEKIANQRKDFLHKLSKRIVDENQVIVVETLKSKNMMKNHKVAKSIADVSWYEFVRQLEYKCKFYGRTLIKADQWFASTQICSSCGEKGEMKTMDIREWTCACGAHHDRDINASINLLMLAD